MINRKQAPTPGRAAPDRVGVAPRGAHPPHPERFWVSNGFDRYRPRRDRSAVYLVLAVLVFWGFFFLGVAMLITEIINWLQDLM